MLNHIPNGTDVIIGRLRPPTPVLRAVASGEAHDVPKNHGGAARLPSRRFSDLDIDDAVRAVLWDMVQEFDLIPRTLRTIHWINVDKFLGAAGFNRPAAKHRSG